METVIRRWTVATWLVAGASDQAEQVAHALDPIRADAIALQSIREHDAQALAAALGMQLAWERSHYPTTRLFPGSAVGLAVLSPHPIVASHGIVCNGHDSLWSSKRRIAQFATVERSDHSTYALVHAVGPTNVTTAPTGSVPLIVVVPEQVGVDDGRAIAVPDAATVVSSGSTRPIDGVAPLQTTVFEQPWVQGDFPVL